MVSSEAYIGVTVNKLLNCVKSVYDRQSVTEIPCVRVEKVQKTFNLESGPLTYSHSADVQGLKVSYLSLTFGLLLYTFPSLTGSCATIDYMHRSIPEIIKVESELVIFLEKPVSWHNQGSRFGFTAQWPWFYYRLEER